MWITLKRMLSKCRLMRQHADDKQLSESLLFVPVPQSKCSLLSTGTIASTSKPATCCSDQNTQTTTTTAHTTSKVWSAIKYLLLLLFVFILITKYMNEPFGGAIWSKSSPISYLCRSYLSSYPGLLSSESKLNLNDISIEDIFQNVHHAPKILIDSSMGNGPSLMNSSQTTRKCSHNSCFDLYRCAYLNYQPNTFANRRRNMKSIEADIIKVYVYPRYAFVLNNSNSDNNLVNEHNSIQFDRMLRAIVSSEYYTNKPNEACLFIPNLDLLNSLLINQQDTEMIKHLNTMLNWLPYYRQMNGSNHLLFMMMAPPAITQQHHIGQAMIASATLNDLSLRFNFDISIPVYSLFSQLYESADDFGAFHFDINKLLNMNRKWTLINMQTDFISKRYFYSLSRLESFFSNRMIMLRFNCTNSKQHLADTPTDAPNAHKILPFMNNERMDMNIASLYERTQVCNIDRRFKQRYLDVLHDSDYCLIMRTSSMNSAASSLPLLSDALMSGCIPIIINDNFIEPFTELIDWSSISIRIREHWLSNLFEVIDSVSQQRINQLRRNGHNVWRKYMSTVEKIAMTTLNIINQRVYPRPKNLHLTSTSGVLSELVPLSYDYFTKGGFNFVSPKNLNLISDGFTTVILTYNRLESLNRVIASVSRVPSCVKILIIWNNQLVRPPSPEQWQTSIFTPIQVITTSHNRLSNRFYPYSSIETEAIFAIDDDITMLNPDEIEFSFQTWREFPDRIVGFPSRLHYWNNITSSWNYDSEWKNKISLILTGAAFYHNYYNYLYTYTLPAAIRDWVDEHMNCEDIAMNFLVSNITCKAPIKVTPRKKFKCSECSKPQQQQQQNGNTALSADVVRHLQLRSYCIDHFANIYKMMPLKAVEFRSDPVLFRDNIPDKFKHFNLIGNL